MRVRWIGLTLAVVLVGAAAGYGVGRAGVESSEYLAAAHPMVAVKPSWPAEPATVVPDSTFPALAPGLRTHPETVGIPPFALTVPIPAHWVRTNPAPGEWRWYPNDDLELNTYFLRVRLVGNRYQPVPDALAERLAALDDASDVVDLDIEERTESAFRATYVSGEHRRLSMERFLPGGTDGNAFAWIALIGREADRAGMNDLFPRITGGARQ